MSEANAEGVNRIIGNIAAAQAEAGERGYPAPAGLIMHPVMLGKIEVWLWEHWNDTSGDDPRPESPMHISILQGLKVKTDDTFDEEEFLIVDGQWLAEWERDERINGEDEDE